MLFFKNQRYEHSLLWAMLHAIPSNLHHLSCIFQPLSYTFPALVFRGCRTPPLILRRLDHLSAWSETEVLCEPGRSMLLCFSWTACTILWELGYPHLTSNWQVSIQSRATPSCHQRNMTPRRYWPNRRDCIADRRLSWWTLKMDALLHMLFLLQWFDHFLIVFLLQLSSLIWLVAYNIYFQSKSQLLFSICASAIRICIESGNHCAQPADTWSGPRNWSNGRFCPYFGASFLRQML